jgi:hypothetical protein
MFETILVSYFTPSAKTQPPCKTSCTTQCHYPIGLGVKLEEANHFNFV